MEQNLQPNSKIFKITNKKISFNNYAVILYMIIKLDMQNYTFAKIQILIVFLYIDQFFLPFPMAPEQILW